MQRPADYAFIAATVLLSVYGQLALKWRMDQVGPLPEGALPALRVLLRLLLDPVVLSSFFAAFLASLAWMAAMTRFELSYAYPFTSLGFVLVLVLSVGLFGEAFSINKAVGVALIVLGTWVASGRGAG